MDELRLPHIKRGAAFEIEVDGEMLTAHPGETVATVLWAAGRREMGSFPQAFPPSRLFCGMGSCRQCLVTINDQPNCRACQTLARPGMKVLTEHVE